MRRFSTAINMLFWIHTLELLAAEAKCSELEKELHEGKDVKIVMSKLSHHNNACGKHPAYC